LKNLNNVAKGYQDLIDEVEKEQAEMFKELKFVLTGVVAGRELTDQEYQTFYDRTIYKKPFADIAFNMRISESACKTYYNRAIKKLSKQATIIKHLLRRK
jgi:DNA-directed RNA polymerase specialized sigma24 family protein